MPNEFITSIKDPRIEEARLLQTNVGRLQINKFLLYSQEQIDWAQAAGIPIDHIFIEKNSTYDTTLSIPILEVSDGILKKISGTSYLIPQIGVARIPPVSKQSSSFTVVLDEVKDLGNIGSIVRTAQSFGIDHFIFSSMDTDAYQRKILDASRGLVLRSTIINQQSPQETCRALKTLGYQIVVTSPHARHLQSQAPLTAQPIALVVGNETNGICDEFMEAADCNIQIPMHHTVESLNVSVAAGISLYELTLKQTMIMLKEKIYANIGRNINVTGKLLQAVFDQFIAKHTEISGAQAILLMIMHCDQLMSLKEIARDVSLFGDELHQFLQPLLEKHFIEQQAEQYRITPEGQRFLAEIWPLTEKLHQQLFADFNAPEMQALQQSLERIQQTCTKMLDKEKLS